MEREGKDTENPVPGTVVDTGCTKPNRLVTQIHTKLGQREWPGINLAMGVRVCFACVAGWISLSSHKVSVKGPFLLPITTFCWTRPSWPWTKSRLLHTLYAVCISTGVDLSRSQPTVKVRLPSSSYYFKIREERHTTFYLSGRCTQAGLRRGTVYPWDSSSRFGAVPVLLVSGSRWRYETRSTNCTVALTGILVTLADEVPILPWCRVVSLHVLEGCSVDDLIFSWGSFCFISNVLRWWYRIPFLFWSCARLCAQRWLSTFLPWIRVCGELGVRNVFAVPSRLFLTSYNLWFCGS